MCDDNWGQPVRILLVEDNPGDIRLTEEALKDAKLSNEIRAVCTGDEAIAYLRREGAYADAEPPDLILLDLHLPGKDGREVLAAIRGDVQLHGVPVAVLTAAPGDEDLLRRENLDAQTYLTKPIDLAGFLKLVQSVEHFGLTVVRRRALREQ
jgi:CheY-like chemotaxis protein